ncbi:MAG: hypothetical protein AAF092_18520 [Pseudomonadota bacterium]
MTDLPYASPAPRLALPGQSPLMERVTLACLLAIPVTLVLLALDTRVLDDEALWLKPLKFQMSMLVHGATLLVAARVLPTALARSRVARSAIWATAAAMAYELLFLSLQAARGVRSHFNDATLFDEIGGTLMAAGAGVLVTGPAVLGLLCLIALRARDTRTPLMAALGLGLILGGVFAAVSGSAIGANGGPFVGAYDPSHAHWPIVGWSREIGDLRIGHFVGLHLMQGLPLAAWALVTAFGSRLAWVAVPIMAVAGSALSLYATERALAGLPLI